MFGIITVSSVLECLTFMPVSFTILRFFLPANVALLLTSVFCLVSLLACWLCRLKLKTFLYRIISVIVSVLLAFISAQVSIGSLLVAVICIFIFISVKSGMDSDRDIAFQVFAVAILFNIVLAFINANTSYSSSTDYSNAIILISTIASVILLIFKQVDDSRRFGQNNMDISTTQRKNNRIFAGVAVVLLLAVSSIGQVSKIYSLILNAFVRFFKLLAYIFTFKSTGEGAQSTGLQDIFEKTEVKDPSMFDMIIKAIFTVLTVIIVAALIGFLIYKITKLLIKIIRRIINWFKNREETALQFTEDGHIDEKQSLYNRNIRNMADKIRNMAVGIFDREIPYKKLPNDIAKIRRLFKYYKNNANQKGAQIIGSSTAKEICSGVSSISPETKQFDSLMSKNYDAARYGNFAPSPQELAQLEERLLK